MFPIRKTGMPSSVNPSLLKAYPPITLRWWLNSSSCQCFGFSSGSPNISTNLALTASSSLSSCCWRFAIRSLTLSRIAAILRCSSMGGRGISVSESVFLLPVPLEFSSSTLPDNACHKYSWAQISSFTVKAANPRPIQHSQFAIFNAPIGARTEIKISFSRAILVGSEHHIRTAG